MDEVIQHDTSTWNVHLSATKEGKRILRTLDKIEKLQKEMVAQQARAGRLRQQHPGGHA